jgi:hypothetical protein
MATLAVSIDLPPTGELETFRDGTKITRSSRNKTGCDLDHVLHPNRNDNIRIGGDDQTTGVDHASRIRFPIPRILPCPPHRNAEAALDFG